MGNFFCANVCHIVANETRQKFSGVVRYHGTMVTSVPINCVRNYDSNDVCYVYYIFRWNAD